MMMMMSVWRGERVRYRWADSAERSVTQPSSHQSPQDHMAGRFKNGTGAVNKTGARCHQGRHAAVTTPRVQPARDNGPEPHTHNDAFCVCESFSTGSFSKAPCKNMTFCVIYAPRINQVTGTIGIKLYCIGRWRMSVRPFEFFLHSTPRTLINIQR